MKNFYSIVVFIALLICCNSCNNSSQEKWFQEESEKGSWTQEDKDKAIEDIASSLTSEGFSEDSKGYKMLCDCYVRGLEVNYDNYDQSSYDQEGVSNISQECANRFLRVLFKNNEENSNEVYEEQNNSDEYNSDDYVEEENGC